MEAFFLGHVEDYACRHDSGGVGRGIVATAADMEAGKKSQGIGLLRNSQSRQDPTVIEVIY